MPLFKITSIGTSKKICKAETIVGVIDAAKQKLDLLSDVSYKVFLEEDGTEIDDDDILVELHKEKGTLLLCIIDENKSWENYQRSINSEKIVDLLQKEQHLEAANTFEEQVAVTSSSANNITHNSLFDLDEIVWSKVSSTVKIGCEEREKQREELKKIMKEEEERKKREDEERKKNPDSAENLDKEKEVDPIQHVVKEIPKIDEKKKRFERTSIVRAVVDYMMNVIHDRRRSVAEDFAKLLCATYPATFTDSVGGVVWDDGIKTVMISIYNGCLYRNSLNPQSKTNKKRDHDSDSDDADVVEKQREIRISKFQDEYGCVDYGPKIPDTENGYSQEEKREKLLQMFHVEQCDGRNEEVAMLMDMTYPTVRALINQGDRDLDKIIRDWPFLKDSDILIQHSSRLLGKNIGGTWKKSLETKSKYMRRYFITPNTIKCKSKSLEMKKLFDESKYASVITRDRTPKALVWVPMVLKYFDENNEGLYKLIAPNSSEGDMLRSVNSNYPTLVIKGASLYDRQAICNVVIQQNIVIPCKDTLEGFLVCSLCYYIFGFFYPTSTKKTLEFIQRIILEIIPRKPTEKNGKAKKKPKTFDKAVKNLADKSVDYSKEFRYE